MQLGAKGEAAEEQFTLPRTALEITFVPRERAFPWLPKRSANAGPRSKADDRFIDVSYEPFFIELAQRLELNLIGGDAPQVDPAHLPGVSPRIGVRAQTLLGCAGLHQQTPIALELWQSDTSRAVRRTRIRTDLVFRVHANTALPHSLIVQAGKAGAAVRASLATEFGEEAEIALPGFLQAALAVTAEASECDAARALWNEDTLAELSELIPDPEFGVAIETYGQDAYVSIAAVPVRSTSALNRFLAIAQCVTRAVLREG